jgi:hypothetical protein
MKSIFNTINPKGIMLRYRAVDVLRSRPITIFDLGVRQLSTCRAVNKQFRRLPSFAKIKSVNLDNYMTEESKSPCAAIVNVISDWMLVDK